MTQFSIPVSFHDLFIKLFCSPDSAVQQEPDFLFSLSMYHQRTFSPRSAACQFCHLHTLWPQKQNVLALIMNEVTHCIKSQSTSPQIWLQHCRKFKKKGCFVFYKLFSRVYDYQRVPASLSPLPPLGPSLAKRSRSSSYSTGHRRSRDKTHSKSSRAHSSSASTAKCE